MSEEDVKNYTLKTEVGDDFDLDDLESMPGFITPPNGVYSITLANGVEEKEINGANYYEVAMTLDEVHEYDDKKMDVGEEAPKAGDIATIIFARSNKYGMSNFKKFMMTLALHFKVTKIGELKELSKGLQMMVTLKRTYQRKSERYNLEVVNGSVL